MSAYLLVLSFNSVIGRIEGVSLFGGILAYTWFNYKVAKPVDRLQPAGTARQTPPENCEVLPKRWGQCLMIVGGTTAVVVTHDMASARKVGARIVMLHGGKFIADTAPQELDRIDNRVVSHFVRGQASPEELAQLERSGWHRQMPMDAEVHRESSP